MGEEDSKQMRRLRAGAAKPERIRKPTFLELRGFKERLGELLGKARPKVPLMMAIHALTESPEFSWFAASGVCRIAPPASGLPGSSEKRKEVASASLEFLFRVVGRSRQNACRAALSLRALEGCPADHLLKFLRLLNDLMDREPKLALHVLGSYSCGPRGASLLGEYADVISLLEGKGGANPAREFASVFYDVGKYPDSARMLLDSMHFTATHLPPDDWGKAISSVREDWRGALRSETFRNNPPD